MVLESFALVIALMSLFYEVFSFTFSTKANATGAFTYVWYKGPYSPNWKLPNREIISILYNRIEVYEGIG